MCAHLAHVFVYEFAQPRAAPFTALFLMVPTRCRPSRVRCRHGGAHAVTTPSTITRRNGAVLSVQPASTSPAWRAPPRLTRQPHHGDAPTHPPHGTPGCPCRRCYRIRPWVVPGPTQHNYADARQVKPCHDRIVSCTLGRRAIPHRCCTATACVPCCAHLRALLSGAQRRATWTRRVCSESARAFHAPFSARGV